MTLLQCWIVALLHLFIIPAFSQPPADPLRNFCRRYGHQTAVIDRKLYIDGGWLYANPISQNPIPTINQGLLYDDLDQTYLGLPKQYANLTKNSSVPDVAGGILWQDEVNKVFWLYGGEFSVVPSTFQLWGYDVILNQWNLTTPTLGSSSPVQRASYGAGVAISESGMAFYYGGYLNSLTNPGWSAPQMATSNLLIYNMDSNTLTNNTGYDNIGRAEGVMVYIPASSAGLLIYFGGVTFPDDNETEVGASMATIMIYDIANWHTQTATGDIPAARRKFCAGATWAKDQSSYNIYLYGGFGFAENITGFDDVYILTMPAFEWIKWYPDQPGPGSPHGSLTCNVIDNAQMIVMGGNFTNKLDCDVPDVQAQHNLNLGQVDATNAKWYPYLPNVTDYSVPGAILQVAGGTSQGGASKKSPTNGWDDVRVSVYFGEKASFTSRTPTRSLPTQTATVISSPEPEKKSNNVGAIAGGAAAGGVVLLLVLLGLVWFCLRRRSRGKESATMPPHHGQMLNSPPTTQYVMGEKYSVVGSPSSTSRVGSPGYPAHAQPEPIHQTSPYSTPPPLQPEYPYYHLGPQTFGQPPVQYYPYPVPAVHPYYHPSSGPQPMQFFAPPDSIRPEMGRMQSHEMPTVKSPEITEIHQPRPMKPDAPLDSER